MTESCLDLSQRLPTLTLSWRRSLSYRNQSIYLHSKSVKWFLHDRDHRHERVILLILTEGPFKKNVIQKKRFSQVKVDEIGTKSDKRGETATKKWCHSPKILLHLYFCSSVFLICPSFFSGEWHHVFGLIFSPLCHFLFVFLPSPPEKSFFWMSALLISIMAHLKPQASVTNQD